MLKFIQKHGRLQIAHVLLSKSNSVEQNNILPYFAFLSMWESLAQNKLGEKKVYWFTGYGLSLREVKARTQGRDPEVGIEWSRDPGGGMIYMACSARFLCTRQDHLSRGSGPLTSIANQENAL